jgi:5-methylcytosine-specific restriction endonuclease McrA
MEVRALTEHQFTPKPSITGYSKGCRCDGCKQAQREYDKARYPRERERRIAQSKRWREANPERKMAQRKREYDIKKELIKARTKRWQQDNPDKVAIYRKRRYAKHGNPWKKANPDKIRFYNKNRKAAKRNAIGSHTLEDWLDVLARFDHCCGRCGSRVNLTQDHIVPIAKGGTHNVDNLQPLCVSCNSWKHLKLICFLPPNGPAKYTPA